MAAALVPFDGYEHFAPSLLNILCLLGTFCLQLNEMCNIGIFKKTCCRHLVLIHALYEHFAPKLVKCYMLFVKILCCYYFLLLKHCVFINGLFGPLDGALDSVDVFNFWDSVINILAETFVFVLVYLVNWMVKTL